MNRHVNAISNRLSLRIPQKESLMILDRISELLFKQKIDNLSEIKQKIQSEFPTVTDFEREFISICFSLATGVGKTRLMGAFITYLYLEHGLKNFFVLAPNLTIYNKLITDFTQNTPKYVFKGIAEFAVRAPNIITGENYQQGWGIHSLPFDDIHINIFNISKINTEVRGGNTPKIKRLSEYIGESYFDYLAKLENLVLIMDESHRYRASAGIKALNELNPILGLELTATPYLETNKGAIPFKNIIYDYALAKAMKDGFVKEPAVVTRKDFSVAGMLLEDIEKLKLEDGIRVHEDVKVKLETYARETGNTIVKPFMLVIARDTTHASELVNYMQSDSFFDSRYASKVIQVDSSSKSSVEEDQMIQRLLKVESSEEPTEIVVHVNMLKEGWDVTNLYTIVPLRAANAKILIEQSIGRGLRLPYGKRKGVVAVDRLNIIAHDKFQEIVDEANKPNSLIQMQAVILDPSDYHKKQVVIVSQPIFETQLGLKPECMTSNTRLATDKIPVSFSSKKEQEIAQEAYNVIRSLEDNPTEFPSLSHLSDSVVQEKIVTEVTKKSALVQMELEGFLPSPDITSVVKKAVAIIQQKNIDIPRIILLPKENMKSGFKPFKLNLKPLNYPEPSQDLWIQHLRTHDHEIIGINTFDAEEKCLEDIIVNGLVGFDDISYEDHADFLYELATQTVQHFRSYCSTDDSIQKILKFHKKDIARFIYSQMQLHYWEEKTEYEIKVSKGFTTELKKSSYISESQAALNFLHAPADKNNISKCLFGGFERCLYTVQKFDSDSERKLAIILDRDSQKWFRPAKDQFHIYYRHMGDESKYQPDFVAETDTCIYMIECKARNQLDAVDVLAKRDAAQQWCLHASDFTAKHNGKPWIYVLIPHDEISENMSLNRLSERFRYSI